MRISKAEILKAMGILPDQNTEEEPVPVSISQVLAEKAPWNISVGGFQEQEQEQEQEPPSNSITVATGAELASWLEWAVESQADLDINVVDGPKLAYTYYNRTITFVPAFIAPTQQPWIKRARLAPRRREPFATCQFFTPNEELVEQGAKVASSYPYHKPMPFNACSCEELNDAGQRACPCPLDQTACKFYSPEAAIVLVKKHGEIEDRSCTLTLATRRYNIGTPTTELSWDDTVIKIAPNIQTGLKMLDNLLQELGVTNVSEVDNSVQTKKRPSAYLKGLVPNDTSRS